MKTDDLIAKYLTGDMTEEEFLDECCRIRSASQQASPLVSLAEWEALTAPPNLAQCAGSYVVEIDFDLGRGHFEHEELGEDSSGCLWVEKVDGRWTLTDYDGVFALPEEVEQLLRDNNIFVE